MKNSVLFLSIIIILCMALIMPLAGACKRIVFFADEQADIYSVIIHELYSKNIREAWPNQPIIYLQRNTDDAYGDRRGSIDAVLLSDSIQNAINENIEDLAGKFIWIDNRSEVIAGDWIPNGGTVFVFGNIHPKNEMKVQVPAGYYQNGISAGGKTYVIELINDSWQITGDTGKLWIS